MPGEKSRAKRTCECCKKEGHAKENCNYIKVKCFRCRERSHPSSVCEKDEEEEGERDEHQKEETKIKEECVMYYCSEREKEKWQITEATIIGNASVEDMSPLQLKESIESRKLKNFWKTKN